VIAADELRGYDWNPSEDYLRRVPALYATEDVPLVQKQVFLHYFCGACDWYVVELDEERRIAFGWMNLGDDQNAELGYFDLNELRDLLVRGPHNLPVVVERDLYFTPQPLRRCVQGL